MGPGGLFGDPRPTAGGAYRFQTQIFPADRLDELGGPSGVSRLKGFRVSKVRRTALLYSDLAIPADRLGFLGGPPRQLFDNFCFC